MRPLSAEQIEALLEHAHDQGDQEAVLVVALLALGGLTPSELVALSWQDVEIAGRRLRSWRGSASTVLVPTERRIGDRLARWLSAARPPDLQRERVSVVVPSARSGPALLGVTRAVLARLGRPDLRAADLRASFDAAGGEVGLAGPLSQGRAEVWR